ncbi:hypothetical protein [Sabulibacter ruber]|uniref:hypothetical protein n=1 Tax=Sabulibacter ruber TaxID=2811901 RepID=UPI001A9676F3|nr:hypothetical protein [Sabulibacter ruber]
MILYQNGLIELEYNPSTDVLQVALPNAHHIGINELQRCLDTIADYIQSYDVKKLLLDSSNSVIYALDEDSYRRIVSKFFSDLKKTRLQRFARIGTSNHSHETRSANITSTMSLELLSSFALETFPNQNIAMRWLLQ